jgi:hypothetical protein
MQIQDDFTLYHCHGISASHNKVSVSTSVIAFSSPEQIHSGDRQSANEKHRNSFDGFLLTPKDRTRSTP